MKKLTHESKLKPFIPALLTHISLLGLTIASTPIYADNTVQPTPAASNAQTAGSLANPAQPANKPQPSGITTTGTSNTATTPAPAAASSPATYQAILSSPNPYYQLRSMAYSGQSDQAIQLAQEYLKHHENSSVRVLLARMLAWNKQYNAAREQLQFVLSKHPGDYDASECLADIEVWNGNYAQAINVLTNTLKYDPQSEKLLEKREIIRCKMLVSQGHRDQAIQTAQEFLKTHDSLDMRIYLAGQLAALKKYDEARILLEYVLNKKPNSTEASIALANVEISSGNNAKALTVIDAGLKFSPQNSDLLKYKQLATNGTSTSSASTKLIPGTQPVQASSGVTYDQLNLMARNGQRQKAIKLAQESLKQNDNSDIRILLGLMLSWEGRYSEARTQLQLVLKKKPDSLDASKALANVELWSDNDKQALAVIDNGLKYHPKDKDLLKQREKALGLSTESLSYDDLRKMYKSGQTDKAKQLAQQILNKNENSDIRLLLGLMQSWDKNYDDARTQLQTVLNNKPGYTDASLALADVEVYQNNPMGALNVLNTALKYHPTNSGLLEKRSEVIQRLNQASIVTPGLFSVFNLPSLVGPYSPGKKLNAVIFNQEVSYVDDLKQTWKITSLGYERYTPFGPIIFTFNQTDRFETAGNQVLIEAYPHLFNGAYMYLGYGYSDTSYIARNYVGIEPFFSLPHGFEFSAGERILQFQGGTTHLYTGSIAKYYGNYWFSFRPYYSTGSHSYYLTARRYFSSPDSYIGLTIGAGSGPSNFDLLNPNSISSDRSRVIRLNGDVPLTENLLFTWLARYSFDHFPNSNIRQETDFDAGFVYRY